MIGGRRQRLLLLTLIVGVLGMHALVVVPFTASAAGASTPPAIVAPVASHDAAAMAGMRDAAVSAAVQSLAGPSGPDRHGAGHGSMPPPTQHFLHLCLAILAALLVLGIAAPALWPSLRPARRELPIGALVRRVPRRRPPPSAVRLAQLCVLRN